MHASAPGSPASLRIAACLAVVALAACNSRPKPGPSAAATTSVSAPVAQAEPPKPKGMPELTVDPMGPYLNSQRVEMNQKGAQEKLTRIVRELPIEGKPVTLIADKKAKPSDVAAVVTELGAAGAPTVIIKTEGRKDLPTEIVVTPEGRAPKPAGCAITTMVLKDLSTAIWPFQGGLGKRQRKGYAGPDLTYTGEQLTKDLAACNANVAFFSADDDVAWELAHNLGGTVVGSDEKKKIEALVLLRNAPVAGRPVQLGGS